MPSQILIGSLLVVITTFVHAGCTLADLWALRMTHADRWGLRSRSMRVTLIAALVLFSFGTGPIKGFAVTLFIGILTSMFTAIIGTRAVINLIYGGRRVEKLAI